MWKKNVPTNANVLKGRFVLSIKNVITPEEAAKARYVVQGHHGKDEDLVVHNFSSLLQRSALLVISFAAVKRVRLFSTDVNEAYMQSDENLGREIYLSPRAEDREFLTTSTASCLNFAVPFMDCATPLLIGWILLHVTSAMICK